MSGRRPAPGGLAARALAALALVALALAVGAPASAAPPRCPDCLAAGAARVALTVPPGTPLAGYGSLARRLWVPDVLDRYPHAFWFRPHVGTLDSLAARALVVDDGRERLVWLTADLIAVTREFTARVARALDAAGVRGHLVLSASHTHSGPGAFLRAGLFGPLAAEREDPAVREAVIASLVAAARHATATLGPARVGTAVGPGPALTVGRLPRPVDRELVVVLLASPAGRPRALLWSYPIHGTMLGPRNLQLSGDVMGLAAQALEQALGVPALYVNGAVGDVSPARHGYAEARAAAAALAGAARDLVSRARPGPPVVAVARRTVALPAPRLSVRNCVGAWVPAVIRVPLGWALPDDTELAAGRLGDLRWVTVPGELQSALGERIKRARPGRPVLVAGLTNDYLGYFVTAEDYPRPGYVTCATLYGPEAGARLVGAAVELLAALDDARGTGSAERRQASGQGGLLARRRVAVQDALGDGLVEGADRRDDGRPRLGTARGERGARRLDRRADA